MKKNILHFEFQKAKDTKKKSTGKKVGRKGKKSPKKVVEIKPEEIVAHDNVQDAEKTGDDDINPADGDTEATS